MLTMMRNIVSSKWGIPLIVIVILGMAVWGVEDIFGGGIGNNFAKAGKRALSQVDVDRRIETYVRNINQSGQSTITKAEATQQGIVDQIFALESSKTSNMGYADAIGILASTRAIKMEVDNQDAFRNAETGEFDLATYQSVLNRNNLSPHMYEQDLQDELTLSLMRGGAVAATKVPGTLGRLQASYTLEERTVAWFVIDDSVVTAQEPPTDEALQAFYTENITGFSQPERRAIDLLSFSAEDYTGRVEVLDTEIEALYEASKAERFSEPETRSITRLVFPDEASAIAAFGRLAGGAPTDKISGALSIDVLTALETDIEDIKLAEAMYGPGKQTGAIFGPMQTESGWLIARLEAITPGAPYSLELVSDLIRNELINERAQAMYYDVLGEIDNFIGAGMSLEEIGKEIGAPVISFLPVDANAIAEDGRSFAALAEAGDAFQQAFRLNAGDIGDRFDTDTHTYIAKTVEIIDASTPQFADVKARVATAYTLRTQADALQSAADAIAARLESGGSTLEAEAELAGGEVDRPPFALTRGTAVQSGLPEHAINGIFASQEGKVLSFPTRDQDQVLILLIEKIERPAEEDLQAVASDAAISLAASVEQDMQAALESEIRTAIGFKPNPAALAAYKASITSDQ